LLLQIENIRDSIKNLNETDFFNNANLHIHTNHSDGVLSPKQVIENAKKDNLSYISITDHNTIDAYQEIPYNDLENVNLITGIEFDCWYKTNFLHILGYGFDLNNEKIKNLCSENVNARKLDVVRFLTTRKAENAIKVIKEAGGIAVLAHPASCWNINLDKMIEELVEIGLDGIEVYYLYIGHRKIVKFCDISKIKRIANNLNLLITGGTDCHGLELGKRK